MANKLIEKWYYQTNDGNLVVDIPDKTFKEWRDFLTEDEFEALIDFTVWHFDTILSAKRIFYTLLELYEGILPGPWISDLIYRIYKIDLNNEELEDKQNGKQE